MARAKPQRERALVGNASDPEQVKRGKDVERVRAEQQLNDQRAVMSTREGRAECWRRLSECGVFKTSMSSDPHWTAYNEGRRAVGLRELAEMMERFPELYLTMQQEAIQRATDEPRGADTTSPESDSADSAETPQ